MTVVIDGERLTVDDVYRVAREDEQVGLAEECLRKIEDSRKIVEDKLDSDETVYGINTGFGDLANVKIELSKTKELQKNLVRSHASGVGDPLGEDVVRAVMLLRANTLAKGYSGIRFETVNTLIDMLNGGVHPVIPSQGSVGASGDLAPLAHMSLVLIGEGEAVYEGEKLPGQKAMEKAGIEPVELQAKEGLALLNGTQVMTAIGVLALHDARILLKSALIAGAMSLEALKGTSTALDERIHHIRPHPGQIRCAEILRKLVEGSEIILSHKDCDKVQDPYTLRCMPQVYGTAFDALDHVKKVLKIEMNSANDNPLVFQGGDIISGGNFHGQPVALAMDMFSAAVSEIGNISERTTDKLMYEEESGLPPFLAEDGGLNSGMMIAQYTAASLVSENKVLSHPASVDSIPTSAGQEDHVSMGTIAARQAMDILKNVQNAVAVELLAASQALEYHELEPGKGVKAAYEKIRTEVEPLGRDRPLYEDIDVIRDMIVTGDLVSAVGSELGHPL
ncbi:MAG: histidine ammonia-lyase [Candidatus Saliniplasma sp.]